ncbi:arsenate reductase ArsC [Streptomyces sp. NPDC019396]|uniref:three-helix bundle dimerization domain-containing protein n=1 Tax=Streptomyces sp. NPDC019396 TaxID=3154687 RepID=UPI003404D152
MSTPSSPRLPDERLAAGAARLASRYAGHFGPETVLGLLGDSYARLAERARIRTHLIVLAERLTEPHIAQALTEAGVDLADAYPKPLTEEVVQAADVVNTMGCGDASPVVPGRRYLDWPVPDPDGAPIAVVRDIRDAIDARIAELLTELDA